MIILWISGIAALVGFIIAMAGYEEHSDDAKMIGIILMIASVVVGFGLLGGVAPLGQWKESIVIPENVAKSEFVVFVKIDGQTLSCNDAKIVSAPLDKIRIKKTDKCNCYGGVMNTSYEIMLAD